MTKSPTKNERKRWQFMQEIGCIACILEGELRGEDRRGTPGDIHHLVSGNRLGHAATICLCPWHHRFVRPTYRRLLPITAIKATYGPSLADSPRDFHDRYGSDITLLAHQNHLLARNFNSTATNAGRGTSAV